MVVKSIEIRSKVRMKSIDLNQKIWDENITGSNYMKVILTDKKEDKNHYLPMQKLLRRLLHVTKIG